MYFVLMSTSDLLTNNLTLIQVNSATGQELRNEASDLRKIQASIESTIIPQLVRRFPDLSSHLFPWFSFCFSFSSTLNSSINIFMLFPPLEKPEIECRECSIHDGENQRECTDYHPELPTSRSWFFLSFLSVLYNTFSSLVLPGDSGGGAEQRGSSTTLPQHKYDTDHQDRE